MKRISAIIAALFITALVATFASANCGPADPPVQLGPGSWFVSNDTIQMMGGDLSQPIEWRGDQNGWGHSPTTPAEHGGVAGVKVEGTGPDHFRWNLVQRGAQNDGWLYIERAFHEMPVCDQIYLPGKIAPNGYDFQGKGPAFWGVKSK